MGGEASQRISEEYTYSIDGKPIINRLFCADGIFDSRSFRDERTKVGDLGLFRTYLLQ